MDTTDTPPTPATPATTSGDPGPGPLPTPPPAAATGPGRSRMARALAAVVDPEIGIDVVSLGLVYHLEQADGHARAVISLTSVGCPVADLLRAQVQAHLLALPGVRTAEVEVSFSPAWSPAFIDADARLELAARGLPV